MLANQRQPRRLSARIVLCSCAESEAHAFNMAADYDRDRGHVASDQRLDLEGLGALARRSACRVLPCPTSPSQRDPFGWGRLAMIVGLVARVGAFLAGGRSNRSFLWRMYWTWVVLRISKRPDGAEHLRTTVPYILAGFVDVPPLDQLLPTSAGETEFPSCGSSPGPAGATTSLCPRGRTHPGGQAVERAHLRSDASPLGNGLPACGRPAEPHTPTTLAVGLLPTRHTSETFPSCLCTTRVGAMPSTGQETGSIGP